MTSNSLIHLPHAQRGRYCLVSVFGNRVYVTMATVLLALGKGITIPYLPLPSDRMKVIRLIAAAARKGGFHQSGTLERRLIKGIKETHVNVQFLDDAANAAGMFALLESIGLPELIPGQPPELPRLVKAPLLWISFEAQETPAARTVH